MLQTFLQGYEPVIVSVEKTNEAEFFGKIKFDSVNVNVGNAMKPDNPKYYSVFSAPVNGIYLFSLTATTPLKKTLKDTCPQEIS